MLSRLNYLHVLTFLFAFALLSGFLPLSGTSGWLPAAAVMAAEDDYCPPELCEEEESEEAVEEDCPPEFCDEAVDEDGVEEEDCPPELCGAAEEDEAYDAYVEEDESEEVRPPVDRTLYSRLTGAMRDDMYQHVADDKEIDAVEQWISDGRKNDAVFNDIIRPIMKENCSKCHSTSSTMSKGIQELPLTTYEEIVAFTKLAPADSVCLECHGDERLENHPDETLSSLYTSAQIKEHSAHNEVPCVRCHYDLHAEQDRYCADSAAFNIFLGSWSPGSTPQCEPTQPPTCVKCHNDAGNEVSESVHFKEDGHEDRLFDQDGNALKAPGCIDCHNTHDVVISKQSKTSLNVVEGCGNCHAELMDTYFESYHGKAALLGSEETAKCFDCHGSHKMVALSDESSPVHAANVEKTCNECHDKVNENFASFIPHADYHDRDNYPVLFYTFWAMNGLLFAVFAAFGVHTALWFYRSMVERKNRGRSQDADAAVTEQHVRRFDVTHTLLHLMVILSFLTLALTGMALKFADNSMFQWISSVMGGPVVLGELHRIGAIVTGAYFGLHLLQLLVMFIKREITISGLFKEDYTMIPLLRDARDVKANMLYFLGKGPKPSFGRWTYWEKFDYMAVFWGVGVIGLSGLMLWFPELVTRYVPGWSINVAYIVHGEEALLATIFIFIAHFFHTHLRPESIPLDPVVFTQRMPLSKFKEERPLEYQNLVDNNKLESRLLPPPSKLYMAFVYLFGFSFVAIGLFLVIAIIYSLLF
ncbi:hypothetical protein [Aestuariirhabdus sp. LZHN29]|uniref:hypothetical protein n=1 Tax=Aestuariirhabdus sp. LZHN29 TaxID=3417462 RepID=UPI003CF2A784